MSRIGKKPIEIPAGVKVALNNDVITVTGPKGELKTTLMPDIEVKSTDEEIICTVRIPSKKVSAYWGLTRSLIANMVEGVTKGFSKKLELVGVGYRAKQNGTGASISVGYSNPVEFPAPKGVEIKVEDNTNITISGIDKQLVGEVAAKIRKIRKPEPYKGKGIKYAGEVIRRKAGKAGKTGAK
jgi:large subunit ribosomal protein L6